MAERLRSSVSPYLRSHADNPVDWFPWGEEALAEAARRDVPVLVSIGYATCHWCHVMARESFSDPVLAARLNADFVAVKVDREEHPDVDTAYLAAASAFTRNLGWPLTVFATPAGEAFFAGTYFPPRAVGGVPAFSDVLDAVSEAWRERRDEVQATAGSLATALREAIAALPTASALPDDAALDAA
ncbi:thioredoxin domain-containing protein, partial [Rathayibacter tanaceti]